MATFFPFFSGIPGCKGKTIVHNFAPDFLEKETMSKKYLSLLWLEENNWQSKLITKLEPRESRVVTTEEVVPDFAKVTVTPDKASLALSKTVPLMITEPEELTEPEGLYPPFS